MKYQKIIKELKPSNHKKKIAFTVGSILIVLCLVAVIAFAYHRVGRDSTRRIEEYSTDGIKLLDTIPPYSDKPYVEINNNVPFFDINDANHGCFERYSDLDALGRCGEAYANLGPELMPTEDRGEIGMIKPTGWHTVKYPDVIEDLYLYNRCHMIAFSLAGENANEKNLITGTRYFNVSGMLPFEIEVKSYIDSTDNHVLYRVTPFFMDDDMLARGVEMEAFSVEDDGKGICFNVFVYNVQPGIVIDYIDGSSTKELER